MSRLVSAPICDSVVVGLEGMNGGLWCSPVAKTSRPISSAFCAMAIVFLMRSCSVGVVPVVGSVVTSPTVKIPNCMLVMCAPHSALFVGDLSTSTSLTFNLFLRSGVRSRWKSKVRTILALIGEKPAQEFRGPLRQHATGNLRPVIEPAVTHDVPQRANGTGLIIECPEDEPAHTSGNQRAGTHRARLQRDHQIASLQPPLPAVLCCLSYRVDFGVAGGIAVAFARIDPP